MLIADPLACKKIASDVWIDKAAELSSDVIKGRRHPIDFGEGSVPEMILIPTNT